MGHRCLLLVHRCLFWSKDHNSVTELFVHYLGHNSVNGLKVRYLNGPPCHMTIQLTEFFSGKNGIQLMDLLATGNVKTIWLPDTSDNWMSTVKRNWQASTDNWVGNLSLSRPFWKKDVHWRSEFRTTGFCLSCDLADHSNYRLNLVQYSSHGLNYGPFSQQTSFKHLKIGLVRYSDSNCKAFFIA